MIPIVRWASSEKRSLHVENVADGVFYIPRFWQETAMGDPDVMLNHLQGLDFPSRSSNPRRYRGNEIRRDVIHINATGDRDVIADYSYTGLQLENILEGLDIIDVDFLQRPLLKLNSKLCVNGHLPKFNHIIATMYTDESDRITQHHDNPKSIASGSVILCASFGARRVFSIHDDKNVVWHKAMESGSAVIMTADANVKYTHALGELTDGATIGDRYSLVFRQIAESKSRAAIEKGAHASRLKKIRAETKRLERFADDVEYFQSMQSEHPREVDEYRKAHRALYKRYREICSDDNETNIV